MPETSKRCTQDNSNTDEDLVLHLLVKSWDPPVPTLMIELYSENTYTEQRCLFSFAEKDMNKSR